jgi:hypothetical protein
MPGLSQLPLEKDTCTAASRSVEYAGPGPIESKNEAKGSASHEVTLWVAGNHIEESIPHVPPNSEQCPRLSQRTPSGLPYCPAGMYWHGRN